MSVVACVVDASVAIKLHLAEDLASEAHTLFACLADPASVFHVPDLFYPECANILWKHVQRGNCTSQVATAHYAALALLPLVRTPAADLCADALKLALSHGITAYDACYVSLAARQNLPLITADKKLATKVGNLATPVIWLGNWSLPPAAP